MIRLFVQQGLTPGATIGLHHDQTHYLINVMRQGAGDAIHLFNGRDGEWRAILEAAGKKHWAARIEAQARPWAPGPDLELIVALVKRGRFETIVEKAAELGVGRVRPITTERTNTPRVGLERLAAVATEAAEQTGRLDVPQIAHPEALASVLDAWDGSRRMMFCDEAGDALPAGDALAKFGLAEPWAILIGPEGGFSSAEREWIRRLPTAVPVSLGPRVLRADTAAIAAMTLWQSALGDWRAS